MNEFFSNVSGGDKAALVFVLILVGGLTLASVGRSIGRALDRGRR